LNGTQARPLPGSPQYVIANAALRALVGLPPILPYMHHADPRAALAAAKRLVAAAASQDLVQTIQAAAVGTRDYSAMTDAELKVAVREIIRTSASAEEVQRRTRDELGYPYTISLSVRRPTDTVGREAQALVLALGGLTLTDGSMVMGMMHGHDGVISL
jgi:hypothetical protein